MGSTAPEPTFTHYVKPKKGPRVKVAEGVSEDDSVKWYWEYPLKPGEKLTVLGTNGARYTREALP